MRKFQFQVDGRGFDAPLRDTWREAAEDLVNSGYGIWVMSGLKRSDDAEVAEVEI